MRLPSGLRDGRDGLLELLAPSRCLSCRSRGPVPWCGTCAEVVRDLPVGCSRCAAPRGAAHACWPSDAPIAATTAVYDYRGPVAAAITTAKVAGAATAWPPLAARLAQRLDGSASPAEVVTYVTTPSVRVRARGFDHAAILAEGVGSVLGLPVRRLLLATADGAHDRYRARHPLPGTYVLLVDDVLTTGATAWRAAACLRSAGADSVELAVLARAGSHTLGAATRRR